MNNFAIIVDCGNTNVSIGIFKEHKFYARIDIPSSLDAINNSLPRLLAFKDKYHLHNSDVKGGLISSVVPSLNNSIITLIKECFDITLPIMDGTYKYDIEINVDNPKEVGGDLLADAIAGKELCKSPCLIIDLGTITKVIVLDEKSKFIGTSFFPGVETCVKSMKEKTALLPEIDVKKKPSNILGTNTIDAMESGIYYGTLGLINHTASLIDNIFKNKKVTKVLTGGNSSLFKGDAKDFSVDPNFVLKGIYLIYINN